MNFSTATRTTIRRKMRLKKMQKSLKMDELLRRVNKVSCIIYTYSAIVVLKYKTSLNYCRKYRNYTEDCTKKVSMSLAIDKK